MCGGSLQPTSVWWSLSLLVKPISGMSWQETPSSTQWRPSWRLMSKQRAADSHAMTLALFTFHSPHKASYGTLVA